MPRIHQQSPRSLVLSVAERHFSDRGYNGVTLRDIADELGIRQASLYHHFPAGKDELFVEVTEYAMDRHADGLQEAASSAPDDLELQLQAIAHWMLSQPPVDLSRMLRSDVAAFPEYTRQRLIESAFGSLIQPIEEVFDQGIRRERLRSANSCRTLAGSFLGIMEAIQVSEQFDSQSPAAMADDMIAVLMDGLRPR